MISAQLLSFIMFVSLQLLFLCFYSYNTDESNDTKKKQVDSSFLLLDKDKKTSEVLETEKGELLLRIAEKEKTLQQVSGNLC